MRKHKTPFSQLISLCMIVRNEEAGLDGCLAAAGGLVDEIVVVDTGSTDRTKEIAARHGARTFDFAWIDDFSAARNESVRRATGDWIFWMDADDRIDATNFDRLRQLLNNLLQHNFAYLMKHSHLLDVTTKSRMSVDQVRLFRNHPQIRWAHRVHEQILPAVLQAGGSVQKTDVVIDHLGYQDAAVRARKHERNLALLRLEIKENADDSFTLFNLGWTLLEMGRAAEALPHLELALAKGSTQDYQAPKLHALLAKAHLTLGRFSQAAAACRRGRQLFPNDPELLFNDGYIHYREGDFRQAADCLETLLQKRPSPQIAFGVDEGISGHLARHCLAVVFRDQGRLKEAESQWRQVLAESPHHAPAVLGLGELLVMQKRWRELDVICCQLEKIPGARTDADVLCARGHLERKEFKQAATILNGIVAAEPLLLWPKVILSRTLLQEGTDAAAAEKVLRDILALKPDHVEAKRNLASLCGPQR